MTEPFERADLVSQRPLPPAPWGVLDVLVAMAMVIGLLIVLILTVSLVAAFEGLDKHPGRALGTGLVATFVFELSLMGVALWFALHRYHLSLRAYGFRGFPRAESYLPLLGVGGAFLILVVYISAASVLHLGRLLPTPNLPKGVFEYKDLTLPAGIEACIFAPFIEESFFRGFVFRGLLGRRIVLSFRGRGWTLSMRFWPAALLSGLLFAAFHGQIGLLVPFTGIGAVFAWIFWRSGALWPNIIAHAGFNTVSFALSLATHH